MKSISAGILMVLLAVVCATAQIYHGGVTRRPSSGRYLAEDQTETLINAFDNNALAVQEHVIYTFGTVPNGSVPLTKPLFLNGKLYGTTSAGSGGCNCGLVYEATPTASGWSYEVIYTFKNGEDGVVPIGNLVADSAGNIYGVTGSGGSLSEGTVYELSQAAGGKWTFNQLYYFGGSGDGTGPDAGLILDSSGNLYGTTTGGGAHQGGTVFELSPGSNGLWNETILYSFSGPDGYAPEAELIVDKKGNLYGTTESGGANSDGVVFKMTPSSGGGWSETVLYSFTNDQGLPEAPVWMDNQGNLYGTTTAGGCSRCGTVYQLTRTADATWTITTLHTFGQDGSDGQAPAGGLTFDGEGNLYGTTSKGGSDYAGTVYQLTRQTDGSFTYDVFYTFPSGAAGGNPSTGVTIVNGLLFGVTIGGPDNGNTGAEVLYAVKP